MINASKYNAHTEPLFKKLGLLKIVMKLGFTNSLSALTYGLFAYYSLLQKARSAALTTGMRRAGVGHSRHMKSCRFQTNVDMPGNIAQCLLYKQFP